MTKEELKELEKIKLTGSVSIKTHKIFRRASLETGKTIGELFEQIAKEYVPISKYSGEKSNSV